MFQKKKKKKRRHRYTIVFRFVKLLYLKRGNTHEKLEKKNTPAWNLTKHRDPTLSSNSTSFKRSDWNWFRTKPITKSRKGDGVINDLKVWFLQILLIANCHAMRTRVRVVCNSISNISTIEYKTQTFL